jgi:hypothetical protein
MLMLYMLGAERLLGGSRSSLPASRDLGPRRQEKCGKHSLLPTNVCHLCHQLVTNVNQRQPDVAVWKESHRDGALGMRGSRSLAS